MSMYLCDATCPSNEQLARRIQDGDPEAASLLLSQNEGYLTMLATSYCEQFSQEYLVDDLKQEGALALLEAAQRFEPSMGNRLLTYATPAIETAMKDCAAQSSFLCPYHWTATTNYAKWRSSMPHTSRTPKQIFWPPFKRSWKSPPK